MWVLRPGRPAIGLVRLLVSHLLGRCFQLVAYALGRSQRLRGQRAVDSTLELWQLRSSHRPHRPDRGNWGYAALDQERCDFIQRLATRKRLSGERLGITDLHGASLSRVG